MERVNWCGLNGAVAILMIGSSVVHGEGAEDSARQAASQVPEMPGTEYLLQLILSLLVVVAAIVVVAWILRRVLRMQGSAAGNIRILAGLSLGSRERIVVVEAGDTQLLLGVAPGRVVSLHVFDKPVFAEPKQTTSKFAKHLQHRIAGAAST